MPDPKEPGELSGDYARDTHREGLGDDYARDEGWSGGGGHEDYAREPKRDQELPPEKNVGIGKASE